MEEKIENIKLLLKINGGTKSYEEATLDIIDSFKHLIPNYTDEKLTPEFLKEIVSEIENGIIPIYDKYFTNEEIVGIIDFYNTPIGKIYLSKMGVVTIECMKIGNKYGEIIYNKLMSLNE